MAEKPLTPEEKALFEDSFPCNSIPFLDRLRKILDENKTNSLKSLKGKELDKAKSCLQVLMMQAYGQAYDLNLAEEWVRLRFELIYLTKEVKSNADIPGGK